MITEAILSIFTAIIEFLLNLLPNVPSMDSTILAGLNYIRDLIVGVVGLISYIESPLILIFAFTAILIVLNFDNIYKLAKWFYHLIRG